MEYFCENPKCLFHVDVAKDVYTHTIIVPGPAGLSSITREKFLWRNPKKNIEWFLCDVCNEVAKMITENTGE